VTFINGKQLVFSIRLSPKSAPDIKIMICYDKQMKHRGLFITFEGADGVGKSTQIRLAHAWMKQRRRKILLTREPGGGAVSEKIRGILLDPALHLENLTELFLYEAARVEHVEKIIRPALKKGFIVLCDRFTDATIAYQGHARGLKKEARLLNALATRGIKPDVTILLDSPSSRAFSRAKARDKNGRGDRLENEGLAFQRRVRQGYLSAARQEPRRVRVVRVQTDKNVTQKIIQKALSKII
jgi:dTMP kinase